MDKHKCNACNKETTIRIVPDYTSTHIWCDKCGCPIEHKDLDLPEYLIILIKNWGLLWDVINAFNRSCPEMKFKNSIYEDTGRCIENEMKKYYDCYFYTGLMIDKNKI